MIAAVRTVRTHSRSHLTSFPAFVFRLRSVCLIAQLKLTTQSLGLRAWRSDEALAYVEFILEYSMYVLYDLGSMEIDSQFGSRKVRRPRSSYKCQSTSRTVYEFHGARHTFASS